MSEYWVSRKKYFCRYCDIYIADDAPSRQQHENGMRHKGNKDRFVRGLYKQGERRKKDLEEERLEMARVDQAANIAYARDISSGHASLASSSRPEAFSSPSASTSRKPSEKPTSAFTNYSTAQSLGYTDPDSERIEAEAERRRTQGVVGEWETVVSPHPQIPADVKPFVEEIAPENLPRKREPVFDDDEDGRSFKMRKKTLTAGLGEVWDPGLIPVKPKSAKVKGEDCDNDTVTTPVGLEVDLQTKAEPNDTALPAVPKWTPRGWKRATAEEDAHTPSGSLPSFSQEERPIKVESETTLKRLRVENPSRDSSAVKEEDNLISRQSSCALVAETEVKGEDAPVNLANYSADGGSSSMFRKRKILGSGAGSRGAGRR